MPDGDGDLISTVSVQFELCDEGNALWVFVPCGNDIAVVKFPTKLGKKCINLAKQSDRILRGHYQNVLACAYRKEHNQARFHKL